MDKTQVINYIQKLLNEAAERNNNPEAKIFHDGVEVPDNERRAFYAGQLDILVHLLRKIYLEF